MILLFPVLYLNMTQSQSNSSKDFFLSHSQDEISGEQTEKNKCPYNAECTPFRNQKRALNED